MPILPELQELKELVWSMNSAKLNERRRIGREIIAIVEGIYVLVEGQTAAYWKHQAEERLQEIARLEGVVDELRAAIVSRQSASQEKP